MKMHLLTFPSLCNKTAPDKNLLRAFAVVRRRAPLSCPLSVALLWFTVLLFQFPSISFSGTSEETEILVIKEEEEREEHKASERISITVTNIEITDVLHYIARQTRQNIVWDERVKGTVTLNLKDVPWKKALEGVLRTKGYGYHINGSIIYVTAGNMDERDVKTEIISLKYGRIKEITSLVGHLLSKQGKIRADARSSSVIITDTPSKIAEIKRVIKAID